MTFTSLVFLFRFLPVFFIVFFLVPPKYRSYVILFGSLLFYTYGDPLWVIFIVVSVILNFIFIRKISLDVAAEKLFGTSDMKLRRLWLVLGLVLDAGLVAAFKYRNFMQYEIPVGVTFCMMSQAACLIEAYRGETMGGSNVVEYAMYATFFPKLLTGADSGYRGFLASRVPEENRLDNIENGALLFASGFVCKVFLVDRINSIWDMAAGDGAGMLSAWLGFVSLPVGIYLELFGYALMAKGITRIMGYDIPTNYEEPFSAGTVSDFARRFMTGPVDFVRKYIFKPLKGGKALLFILAIARDCLTALRQDI